MKRLPPSPPEGTDFWDYGAEISAPWKLSIGDGLNSETKHKETFFLMKKLRQHKKAHNQLNLLSCSSLQYKLCRIFIPVSKYEFL
jgi:hypothetical protein